MKSSLTSLLVNFFGAGFLGGRMEDIRRMGQTTKSAQKEPVTFEVWTFYWVLRIQAKSLMHIILFNLQTTQWHM